MFGVTPELEKVFGIDYRSNFWSHSELEKLIGVTPEQVFGVTPDLG